MFKKMLLIVISISLSLLCGCSKESKFGLEQFTSRMNTQFDYSLNTADFILHIDENENNNLFCEIESSLITLSLDNNNDIKGISLLATDSQDIPNTINFFCNMCCVFTGNDYDAQKSIFDSCQINTDTIKYADSNNVITVGKYKYTVVCNEYSITLFCDRV
ncbi:MAG: hypothetical protein IKB36_01610 [Clostridia bacterium]|nr:hypothetical protein [Clostridia bacterium]